METVTSMTKVGWLEENTHPHLFMKKNLAFGQVFFATIFIIETNSWLKIFRQNKTGLYQIGNYKKHITLKLFFKNMSPLNSVCGTDSAEIIQMNT